MLSKRELKYYASLTQKKYRKAEGKFLAEGKRLVEEGLDSAFRCEIVMVTPEFEDSNRSWLDRYSGRKIRIETVKKEDFNRLADTKTPQGIAGVFGIPELKETATDKILALENISDPGNMGTILRTCDWFGINSVIVSNECAEIYNPKVIRSSMGAVFHITVTEPADFYEELEKKRKEGYTLLAADLDGENLYDAELPEKAVAVMCSEAEGPTDKLLSLIDKKITIPKYGRAESLNVAVAAGIIISRMRTTVE